MRINHSSGSYEIYFLPVAIPNGIVITDENVFQTYSSLLEGRKTIILAPGEQTKSLESYGKLCQQLVQAGANRKSTLIAFGGGVIGDLVGFTAATYMRGVPYIQIPTTLLAQVDSSVGGKTGIDLPEGKNLVGSFHPPTEVQIDTSLLHSLPIREFRSGLAEVLKTAIIRSPKLAESFRLQPLVPGDSRIQAIVQECIGIKAQVVQEDEFETLGIRAELNFGHTIGHALEQITRYSKYTHGEAIAIGMAIETKLAVKLGLADKGLIESVEFLMTGHGLPIKAVELNEAKTIVDVMRKDKKSTDGQLSMSLVKSIGNCQLVQNINEEVVKEVLHESAKI